MRKIFSFILLLAASFSVYSQSKELPVGTEAASVKVFDQLVSKYKNDNSQIGDLLLKVATEFIGVPYVSNTLEQDGAEQLVVNLKELDCTTFAENCLAIARTIKMANPTYDAFKHELTRIRYRDGVLTDYTSRLHYFSDWIFDNDKKSIVKNTSCSILNNPTHFPVNFMSKHPGSYKMLSNCNGCVKKIEKIENEISGREMCFIPTRDLKQVESKIKNGDIIGITTNLEGMDIAHVVIANWNNGELKIIHASSKLKKVVVSDVSLYEYLSGRKDATGIMVVRPLNIGF